MRVTHSMLSDTAVASLMRSLERLQHVQEQITTGRNYQLPSENPTAATQIVRFTSKVAEIEQYRLAISNGIAWNEMTSTVLTEIEDLLAEALDVSERFSNSAATSAERELAAATIESLLEELVMTANRSFKEKYILGGTRTLTAPFTAQYDGDGELITGVSPNPQGLTGVWSYRVSEVETMRMNTRGNEVLQPIGQGFEGDVFKVLVRLREAFEDGDFDAMATEEGELREAISRVVAINARVGSRVNRLEAMDADLETQVLTYEGQRSELEDTDLAEAIVEFNTADTVYQAALASTARILQLSLADFL